MSDQTPPKSRRAMPAVEPQRVNVRHLGRVADSGRDLGDPTLTAKASDKEATFDVHPAPDSPRSFGQLQDLSVPDTFDDQLPDPEITAWEGNSPPASQRHKVTQEFC
jgi:hypothetical protein